MKRILFSGVLALVVAVLFSCNDASVLGSNILPAENNLEVDFTDTISLISSTIKIDSTRVYDPNPSLQPGRYITGRVEDPVFGIYSSNIYTQFELLTTNPDFSNAVLDSVVLLLAYDNTGGFYGEIDNPFTIKVREIEEYMAPTETYQSFQTFATSSSTLGKSVINGNSICTSCPSIPCKNTKLSLSVAFPTNGFKLAYIPLS